MRLVAPAGPHTGDAVIWLGAKDTVTFRGLWLETPKSITVKKQNTTQAEIFAPFWPSVYRRFPILFILPVHTYWARQGAHVEVCVRQSGDWWCHIDGLVCSLLAAAIRSAAQETAARLLRNADARLTPSAIISSETSRSRCRIQRHIISCESRHCFSKTVQHYCTKRDDCRGILWTITVRATDPVTTK